MDLGERIKGKRVFVTGASSGLGAHFARLVTRHGAAVAIGARRRDRLDALRRELESLGVATAVAVDLDVTDETSAASALAEAERAIGPLDILINNAGVAGGGLAMETPLDEFDRIVATNLRGVWLMSVLAARRWRDAQRGGVIVNIASILGLRVAGAVGPYAISKAGVVQMTEALALEWARHGIRVNALAPGYIATDINQGFLESDPGQVMVKRIPMRRVGQPQDLDGALLLLATDASAWMTGAVIPVDGGHLVSSL
jgi:NAD(P)-dependent dehydrogenase (short-subunit alcohol dehydrogenase family)